jgi:hypothetical protein
LPWIVLIEIRPISIEMIHFRHGCAIYYTKFAN